MSSNKVFKWFAIVGLAIGSALLMFLAKFAMDEMSYDRHHSRSAEIYRLETTFNLPNGDQLASAVSPSPASTSLQTYFSGDIEAVTMLLRKNSTIRVNQNSVTSPIFFIDENVNSVLNLAGAEEVGKLIPGTALISKTLSNTLFAGGSSVGQQLIVEDSKQLTIVGIFEQRKDTHLKMSVITPAKGEWASEFDQSRDNWYDTTAYIYFRVKSNDSISSIKNSLEQFVVASAPQLPGAPFTPGEFIDFNIRPIADLHYDIGLSGEIFTSVSPSLLNYLQIIILITAIILVLNYFTLIMNVQLSNAHFYDIRRLLGASHFDLIKERMKKSVGTFVLIVLLFTLASMLVYYAVNSLNMFSNISASVSSSLVIAVIAILALIVFCTSAVITLVILKRKLTGARLSRYGRLESPIVGRLSLILQVTACCCMLFVGVGMVAQSAFMQSSDYGYSGENVYSVSLPEQYHSDNGEFLLSFKDRVLADERIDSVSFSSWRPFARDYSLWEVQHPNQQADQQMLMTQALTVNPKFFDVWDISLLAGTGGVPAAISENTSGPNNGFAVINESLASRLGFNDPSEAINYDLINGSGSGAKRFRVIGVSRNFSLDRIKSEAGPLLLEINNSTQKYLTFNSQNKVKLQLLQDKFQSIGGTGEMRFNSVSNLIEQEFAEENRVSGIITLAGLLSTLFALMGVVALGGYEAFRLRRVFEIMTVVGGYFVTNFQYFLKVTVWPIGLGAISSLVLGWYILNQWSSGFSVVGNSVYLTALLGVILFTVVAALFLFLCFWNLSHKVDIKHLAGE